MIYTIEKRFSFGYGEMESWWEARSYERRTPIGVLVGGKCLKNQRRSQIVVIILEEKVCNMKRYNEGN